jgi:undecaprenyl diphosphate synthase
MTWTSFDTIVAPDSPEGRLLEQIDPDRLHRHIAVIMDGNGRWAKARDLPRVDGHKAGADSVKEIIENCARLGIDTLTLYAFSVENWKRPKAEIDLLMELLRQYLQRDLDTLMKNDIRLKAIGRIHQLPRSVQMLLRRAEKKTAPNRRLRLNLALNYGGRTELVDAFRSLAADVRAGRLDPDAIDVDAISDRLYTAGCPEPDLLIRTSSEYRISNFLLWQIAYAEFHITPVLWPDFRRRHLFEAIIDFQHRERRFGGL